ncbi:hypothetical protein GGTG_04142 [Gaeumannomyces tritici R3-111a-1]|uniref:Uncharacterized protein n=1 Tax=Gaeumannomyces tritici (strain R3-111a-1) TaxID=644352 RepID=J3NS97_GAET3|nr:hypothetical protein GGTG_04142 [Gaeumannomyces tritici R3-111a-1]EJT79053.1 hypothetical protein GGTG_04142 [Gaeumannomyces tritici R3-111a-1]
MAGLHDVVGESFLHSLVPPSKSPTGAPCLYPYREFSIEEVLVFGDVLSWKFGCDVEASAGKEDDTARFRTEGRHRSIRHEARSDTRRPSDANGRGGRAAQTRRPTAVSYRTASKERGALRTRRFVRSYRAGYGAYAAGAKGRISLQRRAVARIRATAAT